MAKEIKYEVFPTKYSESAKFGTFEYNNSPSMTEPDNAMSIPEIIARFTRGQGISVQQRPWTSGSAPEGDQYLEEESFSDIIPGMQQPAQQQAQQPAQQQAQQQAQQPAQQQAQQPAQQPAQQQAQVYPGGPGESAHVIPPKE